MVPLTHFAVTITPPDPPWQRAFRLNSSQAKFEAPVFICFHNGFCLFEHKGYILPHSEGYFVCLMFNSSYIIWCYKLPDDTNYLWVQIGWLRPFLLHFGIDMKPSSQEDIGLLFFVITSLRVQIEIVFLTPDGSLTTLTKSTWYLSMQWITNTKQILGCWNLEITTPTEEIAFDVWVLQCYHRLIIYKITMFS